jgi:hypothetical protein
MQIRSTSSNQNCIVTIHVDSSDPTLTDGKKVDVSTLTWTRNGISNSAESTTGIGSPDKPFIVARLDSWNNPTMLYIEDKETDPRILEEGEYNEFPMLCIAKLIFVDDNDDYAADEIYDIEVYHTGDYNDSVDGFGEQLGHSFVPTRTDLFEATVAPGFVTRKDGTRELLEPGTIDFSSETGDKYFFVEIDYSSESQAISWKSNSTGFPNHTVGKVVNFPVLEFSDNTWLGLIRHQTNDIIDGAGDDNTRGTMDLFKVKMLRAYYFGSDLLVDASILYDPVTMYLHPTWDWPRFR